MEIDKKLQEYKDGWRKFGQCYQSFDHYLIELLQSQGREIAEQRAELKVKSIALESLGRVSSGNEADREYFKQQLTDAFKLLFVCINNAYDDDDPLTISAKKLIESNRHTAAYLHSKAWAGEENLIY